MKRLSVLFVSALIGLTANAQVFVGGNIGYIHDSGTDTYSVGSSKFRTGNGFTIGPEVGYRFNEKWTAGLSVIYAPSFSRGIRTEEPSVLENLKQWTNRWDFSAFGRYSVWGAKGFNVCLQGELMASVFNRSNTSSFEEAVGSDNESSMKGLDLGIQFYPVLTYDISKHLTAVAKLNLLGAVFQWEKITTTDSSVSINDTQTTTRYSRYFLLNLNKSAEVQFGIEYRF